MPPEQLQRAVACGIEEHRLPVRKADLYGSVARGEDDPRSDVDIAVVVETDGDSVRSGLEDLAEELQASFGTNFHFMIATRPLDEMARKDDQGGALWAQIAAEAVEFVRRSQPMMRPHHTSGQVRSTDPDHLRAADLLQSVTGDGERARQLRGLIGLKNEVEYQSARTSAKAATDGIARSERFVGWVREMLR